MGAKRAAVTIVALLAVVSAAAPAAASPPTVPAGVEAVAVGGSVVLSWDAASDADGFVRTYEIERDGRWVGWTYATTRTFTDAAVGDGAGHTWTVYAMDNERQAGPRSAPVSVSAGDPPAATEPSAPSALMAVVGGSRIELFWNAATDGDGWVRTYEIERDGRWAGWTWGSVTSWIDSTADLDESHTYRVYAIDNERRAGPRSAPVTTSVPPAGGGGGGGEAATLLATGDIARCGGEHDGVAALIAARPGTFAALGDLAYPDGSVTDFANCYDPAFGPLKARTRPTPGNHEYVTPGAAGYFDYFGARAGSRGAGYYSYELGAWHVVVLNSECWHVGGCGTADPQYRWLDQDLADAPACVLAYWHRPLFTTERGAADSAYMAPYYDRLQAAGADVVLNGHAHVYERWGRMNSAGQPDGSGIRNFTVGVGGASLRGFDPSVAGLEHRGASYGVLELTLRSGGYDWNFLRSGGPPLSDAGSDTC